MIQQIPLFSIEPIKQETPLGQIEIFNENCLETMQRLGKSTANIILTSPPYNTNKKAGKNRTLNNTNVKDGQYDYVRYDGYVDNLTNKEYCDKTVCLFNAFDDFLTPNGCVLYNLSYGSENTEGMFLAVSDILQKTNFTLADTIVWKKRNAFPNSCSPNKLTRITEFVFVFCRKNELGSFACNEKIVSTRKTGQKMYENVFNYIEAPNNDGSCSLNKATFSSDLVRQLLEIYATKDMTVYDPFMGTGTTAVACKRYGCKCIGSEISEKQVAYAKERVRKVDVIGQNEGHD
jgi:DNA modification methylase